MNLDTLKLVLGLIHLDNHEWIPISCDWLYRSITFFVSNPLKLQIVLLAWPREFLQKITTYAFLQKLICKSFFCCILSLMFCNKQYHFYIVLHIVHSANWLCFSYMYPWACHITYFWPLWCMRSLVYSAYVWAWMDAYLNLAYVKLVRPPNS